MSKKLDVIVDLQFGSTGKGLLAGYLSEKNGYDAVVSANMPNAGHVAYAPNGGPQFIHKVLPSGIFSPNLRTIGVGPGAVFDVDRLEAEWKGVCDYLQGGVVTLVIHDAAGILTKQHQKAERATLSHISSTMQGSAEALISKIRRQEGSIAKHHAIAIAERMNRHGPCMVVDQFQWLMILDDHESILAEGSQGYSLSISAGFFPYCTSRDCTPARVIADCSLPVGWLRDVYGSCRTYPIRVGNTPDGHSGDWYSDQTEVTFAELGVPEERTTVTQRVRRIATFSPQQISEAMMMATPSHVFLNFVNYNESYAETVCNEIDRAARRIGCGGVTLIGRGPRPEDILEAP